MLQLKDIKNGKFTEEEIEKALPASPTVKKLVTV